MVDIVPGLKAGRLLPSLSPSAGWYLTGCCYFGSSLILPYLLARLKSRVAHSRLIYFLRVKNKDNMTCGKKSTKKSPAYRRGFKPNFSVSPLLFRIGFFHSGHEKSDRSPPISLLGRVRAASPISVSWRGFRSYLYMADGSKRDNLFVSSPPFLGDGGRLR